MSWTRGRAQASGLGRIEARNVDPRRRGCRHRSPAETSLHHRAVAMSAIARYSCRHGGARQNNHPADRRRCRRRRGAARRRCLHTPLVTSPVLDALTGARVFLKAETLQRTGSFKFRGAYNKLSSIPTSSAPAAWWRFPPAITRKAWRRRRSCSACRAVIVMPSDAPRAKRERTAALGAEVVLYDRGAKTAQAIAREHRRRARRRAGAALRRSAGDRRAGNRRPRDRRGSGGARARARVVAGHRLGRRA